MSSRLDRRRNRGKVDGDEIIASQHFTLFVNIKLNRGKEDPGFNRPGR